MKIPEKFLRDFQCCDKCLVRTMCIEIRKTEADDGGLIFDVTPLKPCDSFRETLRKRQGIALKTGTSYTRTFTYFSSFFVK